MTASEEEAREFARAFQGFLGWVHETGHDDAQHNEVSALLTEFLGTDAGKQSVVARSLPVFEHVNLQTALNAWSAEPGRHVDVRGISIPSHFGRFSLRALLSGHHHGPPMHLSAPDLIDLANGPGSTLGCLRLAILLVTDARGRYAVLITAAADDERDLRVEVAGLPLHEAQAVHASLDALRSQLNVYRGHIIEVTSNDMGGVSLSFAAIAPTPRDDVVLPEAVLARIERHALGVARHREALLASGQHLKRGLLLYGPPGTGKTHTTTYLVGRMAGYTRLLLSGRSLHAVSAVAELARELQPAVIVLEDVDLVAMDREYGPGHNSALFELLDAMDGAAADADLLFLLTTNRADLLEPALAARPGRVDVAVEIGLPDAAARTKLFDLYGRGVGLRLSEDERAVAIARAEGVTASFLKELIRRAVLESLDEDAAQRAVHARHVERALDDLLDSAQQLTRSLLGVGFDPEQLPAGAGMGFFGHGEYGDDDEGGESYGWYGPMPDRLR